MSVALAVVTDGRWQYLSQCLSSISRMVPYPFAHVRVVNDSGWDAKLVDTNVDVEMIDHPQRLGLAAAVQSAWTGLPVEIDYLFHVEEDFVFVEPVDIDGMAGILKEEPRLAQLVLKRQPWSPVEIVAGGIIELHPEDYTERVGWVEHRRIFSLNPCLIPREVVDSGWPAGNEAEMTQRLIESGWSFGFWGGRADPPPCLHIGAERSQDWKL